MNGHGGGLESKIELLRLELMSYIDLLTIRNLASTKCSAARYDAPTVSILPDPRGVLAIKLCLFPKFP